MHEFPQNGALRNSKPADAHIGMSPSRDPHQIEQERGRAHVRVSVMYPRSRRSLYSAARGSVDYLGSSNRKSRRLFSMAKKPDVVRFAVGNPDGPQSPVWRLWTSGKGSDVYLAARTIADQAKVSFRKSGKRRLAFTEKYASGPNSYVRPGEDRATSKWHRPPEVAPGITRSFLIMVPASEVTSPKVPFASKPDTIWVPTAPSRLATCLTIFFTTPAADIGRITADIGRISSFTQSVGRIRLRNRETVRVFAHHQHTTESQKLR
jgi:hypothetical protein